MHPISRRVFLAGSVAVVVGACSSGDGVATTGSDVPSPSSGDVPGAEPTTSASAPATIEPTTTQSLVELSDDPFTLGVASGDPTADTVVLWTRLAPDPLAGGGMPADDIEVTWELCRDESFGEILAGTEQATATHGHSVHALVSNPDQSSPNWFYRFRVGSYTSPIGRTSFAPAAGSTTEAVTFASASCQHYESGFYTAHRDLVGQQPDFVVFLGDYIYEGSQNAVGEGGNVRTHGTDECTTLDDYRNRYALYKGDADLQAAHAACPWFVTWDDHEVENNYAGLVPQDAADQAGFEARRQAAYQAWWEHQPVALAPPSGAEFTIYRAAQWGELVHLVLLDGRQYRSDQACGDVGLSLDPPCPETTDPVRSMLGDTQEAWLFEQLDASTATWNTIAQQTVFGDTTVGGAVLNYDQWDGYPVQRNRIVDRFATDAVANVVVLTGDIHFAGTGTIRSGERGVGTPVGVEFVATSISSGGRIDPAVTDIVRAIPDILDAELEHRGYILHRVTSELWQAEYRMIDSVKVPESTTFVHATYEVAAGTNLVRFATT